MWKQNDCRNLSGHWSVSLDVLTWYIDGLPMTRWGGSGKQFFNRVNAIGTSMFVLLTKKEQINRSIIYDARCLVVSAPRSGRWKAATTSSWTIVHPKRRTKATGGLHLWAVLGNTLEHIQHKLAFFVSNPAISIVFRDPWYDQTSGETEMLDGTIRIARSHPGKKHISDHWDPHVLIQRGHSFNTIAYNKLKTSVTKHNLQ